MNCMNKWKFFCSLRFCLHVMNAADVCFNLGKSLRGTTLTCDRRISLYRHQLKKKRQSHTPVIYIPPPPPLPPELKRALWVKTAQVAMEHPREAEPAVWVPDHMLTLIKGKRERTRTICNVIISKTWFQGYPSDHMTLQVTMFLRSFHPVM